MHNCPIICSKQFLSLHGKYVFVVTARRLISGNGKKETIVKVSDKNLAVNSLNSWNRDSSSSLEENSQKENVEFELRNKIKVSDESSGSSSKVRYNDFNIQMLSTSLYNQLFGDIDLTTNSELINSSREELMKHNLLTKQVQVSDVAIDLPKLKGGNLEEHFWNIGEEQCGAYRKLVEDLISVGAPKVPQNWVFKPGWTRYSENGSECVHYPQEKALVFDVEVCMSEGEMPTMATAVSKKAWYSWVSPDLVDGSKKYNIGNRTYTTDRLIPIESGPKTHGFDLKKKLKEPMIVVGHNVSFDRARIKEQYWLEKTGSRFLDTMSMHVCVSGVTSYQKAMLKSGNRIDGENDWMNFSSLNSLSKVHQLYCGTELEKEKRDIFVTGSLSDVRNEFQALMTYCAGDTLATFNVLVKLFPMFLERFPHPVTLAGMLELGSAYLPVNENWTRYIDDSNRTFYDFENETKHLLTQRANHACGLLEGDRYKDDLWLWDQDWSVQHLTLKKNTKSKVKNAEQNIVEEGEKSKKKPRKSMKMVSESMSQDSKEEHLSNDAISKKMKELKKFEDVDSNIKNEVLLSINNNLEPHILLDEIKNNEFACEQDESFIALDKKFNYLMNMHNFFPKKMPHLPGYPLWYRKLCLKFGTEDWIPGPVLISTGMQIAPKLLSLTWKSMPLHYMRGEGWGYLVPYDTNIKVENDQLIPKDKFIDYCISVKNSVICSCKRNIETREKVVDKEKIHEDVQTSLVRFICKKLPQKKAMKKLKEDKLCLEQISKEKNVGFIKLPHKNGKDFNVGNPLAKDFVSKFSENELGSSDAKAQRIIQISRMLSYWRNNKDRVEGQIVVWLGRKDIEPELQGLGLGAILPQVISCGTLTRRAVERTWMTASNAVDDRIGSELRAMIQAPSGFNFVGADVDAQELWIASLIGDAYHAKQHGATPFGWMTLSGSKSDCTDMHSVTAKAVGITRSDAKVINYARIYGAGQNFAERLLKQFNPDMSVEDAKQKAKKMFVMTKGKRVYRLLDGVLPDSDKREFTKFGAREICKLYGKNFEELFEAAKWVEGSESAMFNRLEEIAGSDEPQTPFLSGRLSRALEPTRDTDDQFVPTRINWVVQSGAVDFLHLMLVSMRWLMSDEARFCLSFHDEVRYLVRSHLKYETALALHVTNLLVRALCVRRLGMTDLPRSVAFFSSVEVDTVLRKEADNQCITPSNPFGLQKGYAVPPGESLDIDAAISKANGVVGIHSTH
ncbi:DNA polymerase subunit gamma-1, mitochondrial [Nilaparvata lugens]|uniref:DNA polymerase subunit gamma-1, mitochondrial n=1 Tax=Nilaparvata lugens TaxID=108931 RepID=UPI00193D0245|nr:DNA polymerase subunit gamma-1, mitochondrial [Nilaparvata lugens]